ncbi:MAG TPA: hypothetical protein VFF21_03685, partial [Flavobacteriaceae bacterium]|nr:hypothetical protein [Flavobacteriaceae bacterium]
MQREFLKNLIFNNLSQGMQFGSRWIFNLILISLLTDYDFGVFAYILALANILMGILPFGSTTFLLGDVDPEDRVRQLGRTIALICFLFLISIIIYLILLPFQIEHYDLLIYGILLGLVYSLNLILFFFLKSIGRFKEEIKASAILLGVTVMILVYFYFGIDKLTIPMIFGFAIVSNLAVALFMFFSKYIPTTILLNEIRKSFFIPFQLIKERLYFGLQELMTTSYTQIGLFVMFYFMDPEVYGIFRKIFIVIAPILLFVVTFSQVLLYHLKKAADEQVVTEFRKYLRLMGVAATIIMIGMWFFKPIILETVGKLELSAELSKAYVLVVIAVGVRFLFVNYEMLLVRFGKQHLRFWVMFAAMVVNFLTIVTLTPLFGLMGAVLVDLITNATILAGLAIVAERQIKKFNLNHSHLTKL